MPSKEEIEKAKERIKEILSCYDEYKKDYEEGHQSSFELDLDDFEVLKTLLQYIDQLEQENNKLNKIIDKMAEAMYSNISMLEMAKIGQAIDYDPRKMFAGISDEEAIDCIKQYFEKKVDENVK